MVGLGLGLESLLGLGLGSYYSVFQMCKYTNKQKKHRRGARPSGRYIDRNRAYMYTTLYYIYISTVQIHQ